MSNGKGDTPRPLSVPAAEYASNWERTFGPKITPEQMSIMEQVAEQWVPLPQMIAQAHESAQAERERTCCCGHQRWEHDTLGWTSVCDLVR